MTKAWKDKIRKRVISEFRGDNSDEGKLKEIISRVANEVILHESTGVPEQDKLKVIQELIDEFVGFGPIDPLMRDPSVTEIMINGPKKVYAEKNGKTALSGIAFDDDNQLMYLIHKILAPTRRHVDESCPYTDVSTPEGSRVNIIIPPLALDGATVTIRKFLEHIKDADDLIRLGTMDKRMADFLIASIKAKANMIFSGATGAGKTTALNVLSSYIANDERIVTIEDTAELHLRQEHVVRLEAKQANIEGRGEISLRELFKNTLRMRPDRIILGEIRGAEALDMLQAMCSGHSGSLAVIHANSPADVIHRLTTMILTTGLPITLEAIHRQIAAALNIIIQQEQLFDGSRKITRISQISGIKDGQAALEDIFVFQQEGFDPEGKVKGKWVATGVIPIFYSLFEKSGVNLPKEIFNKG